MSQPAIKVREIAALARLEITAEEEAIYKPQLEAILRHVATLAELDVSGIDPTAHPTPVSGPMREDRAHESLPVEAVLQNAPDQSQNQIRVPKVVTDA